MKLLEKYLAKTILSAIGLITLLLVGLQFFILFVNQLNDLGRGNFHVLNAIAFVLLQLPYQVYLFFPVASLLGALVGLGVLANNSELIVMRAAGFSVRQIIAAVIKAALLVIIIVTTLGETFIPQLSEIGNTLKIQALSNGQTLTTARGVWMRVKKDDFISIGAIRVDNTLENVYQFHFNQDHEMAFVRKINNLAFKDGLWQATSVVETWIFKDKTLIKKEPKMILDLALNPQILRLSSKHPDEMSLFSLGKYIKAQTAFKNNAAYELVFWQRLFQPLTTMVMMILAIPFILGPLRSSSIGSRLVTGVGVGFGFYLMNNFLGPISQVYQLSPILAALGPTLVFAYLGVYLMRRVR